MDDNKVLGENGSFYYLRNFALKFYQKKHKLQPTDIKIGMEIYYTPRSEKYDVAVFNILGIKENRVAVNNGCDDYYACCDFYIINNSISEFYEKAI